MTPEEAKKWAGKNAVVISKDGNLYRGMITNICNEFCDSWTLYFDDLTGIEVDEIESIEV